MEQLQIWQSLVIAIWVALIQSRVTMFSLQLRYGPLMTALIIGIVMGDVAAALQIGVAVQLALFNVGGAGGQTSAEPSVATAIAVPVAMMSGMDPAQAAALSIPIGILGSYLYQTRHLINTGISALTEKNADNTDDAALTRSIIVYPLLTSLAMYVVVLFIALHFGAPLVADFTEKYVQGTVSHVLSVIGGALSVTGLAAGMVAIGKKQLLVFFILSYFLTVNFSEVNILTWAIIGICVAVIYVYARSYQSADAEENSL